MTKEQLREVRARSFELRQIRNQLQALETRMYSIGGQQFSVTPRGGNSRGHTMDDLVSGHVRLQKLYQQKLVALEREQAEIEEALSVLTANERLIIRARYFEGKSWDDVCRAVHYEWAQTHRLHGSALRKLEAQK